MSDMSTVRRALDVYDASYPPSLWAQPDPQIDTLTPSTVSAAAGATTITVAGSNFVAGSVVEINQAAQATTFVSATSLTVSYDPTVAGTVTFTVRNPSNEESNSVPFVVGALAGEPQTTPSSPQQAYGSTRRAAAPRTRTRPTRPEPGSAGDQD
jgi:hypothetical protein